MDTDRLIRDYLSRLEAAASSLPVHRRAELTGEVRDHIDAALTEAGRRDEVTVRNILEQLGSPEEIVAGEAGQPGGAAGAADSRSRLGRVEIAAMLLLALAWVALFLPFGFFLWLGWWLGFGVVGLVLLWISKVWRKRQKLITTGVVVVLYLAVFLLSIPVY
ncbi:MAG: hypothetical protein H0W81_02790 [Chloroflexi bacterium]|nr:hypothetical protein [Chloroflexota bacterium]